MNTASSQPKCRLGSLGSWPWGHNTYSIHYGTLHTGDTFWKWQHVRPREFLGIFSAPKLINKKNCRTCKSWAYLTAFSAELDSCGQELMSILYNLWLYFPKLSHVLKQEIRCNNDTQPCMSNSQPFLPYNIQNKCQDSHSYIYLVVKQYVYRVGSGNALVQWSQIAGSLIGRTRKMFAVNTSDSN